jgi:hypothetical protein
MVATGLPRFGALQRARRQDLQRVIDIGLAHGMGFAGARGGATGAAPSRARVSLVHIDA